MSDRFLKHKNRALNPVAWAALQAKLEADAQQAKQQLYDELGLKASHLGGGAGEGREGAIVKERELELEAKGAGQRLEEICENLHDYIAIAEEYLSWEERKLKGQREAAAKAGDDFM